MPLFNKEKDNKDALVAAICNSHKNPLAMICIYEVSALLFSLNLFYTY